MNRNQESFVRSDVPLPVVRLHENLNVVTLDPLGHGRTMGYWYLVRQGPVYAHTAFNKRENLLTWLRELGLTLDSELPPHGVRDYVFVSGVYRNASHLSYDTFNRQRARGTVGRALSNGDYTMSINTLDSAHALGLAADFISPASGTPLQISNVISRGHQSQPRPWVRWAPISNIKPKDFWLL